MGNEMKLAVVTNDPSMEQRIESSVNKLIREARARPISIPVGIQATATESSVSLDNTQNSDRQTDFTMVASVNKDGVASVSLLECKRGSATKCKSMKITLHDKNAVDKLRDIIINAANNRNTTEI